MSFPLALAETKARELWSAFAPHCVEGKCKVAGDIRRQVSMVKNIILIVQPSNINHFAQALTLLGAGGLRRKDKLKEFNYGSIPVELYVPSPKDFFACLVRRTGSVEYVRKVINPAIANMGYVGTYEGLVFKTDCEQVGEKWIIKKGNPNFLPQFDSEEQFYFWLGEPFLEPNKRL